MFEQIIEFSMNHPLLVGGLFSMILLALFLESQRAGKALSTHELTAKMNSESALVLDVRDAAEFSKGHIVDAINIPLAKLDSRISEIEKYKKRPIVVVCQLGQHSGQAVQKLQQLEFEAVYRLSGGVSAWRGESLPLVKA